MPVRSRILEAGQQAGLYSIETDGYEFSFYVMPLICFMNTLIYQIDVQDGITVQGGKFLKN